MSLLSRVFAPAAIHDLAGFAADILSNMEGAPLSDLSESFGDHVPVKQPEASIAYHLVTGPTGLGTSAARLPSLFASRDTATSNGVRTQLPGGLTGLGTSAARVAAGRSPAGTSVPELFCPGAVRDDPALGEEVNNRLVEWAEQVGIYPGQLDRLRVSNFGRLMMLTHPATDDPDRLLAAAKCVLAEWATDDHFLDDESMGADAKVIGSRLAITYAAVDPADLPVHYAPQLDRALSDEPVAVAYRSAFDHLAQYATPTQMARLRHELSVMFMAYNQEADWRAPPGESRRSGST